MLLKGFSDAEKETMQKNLERIYQNVREVTAEPTKDADKEVKANK